jgi:hypothetical protein
MRTPDKHTTETWKRPHSQIADHLQRLNNPLKPHLATNKRRQRGTDRIHKIIPVRGVAPVAGHDVVLKNMGHGRGARAEASTNKAQPTVLQRIVNRA